MEGKEPLHEFNAPSGDVYKFRLLTYGEKMDIIEKKAKGVKARGTAEISGRKGFRKKPGEEEKMTSEFEMDLSTTTAVRREAVWVSMIVAPWLSEGQKCTKELADKNIKGTDAEAINDFVDKLNYPEEEVLEKSDGQ